MKFLLIGCMALLPLTVSAQDTPSFLDDLIQKRESSVGSWQASTQAQEPSASHPFTFEVAELSDQGVVIDWDVMEGYYLYNEQFSISDGESSEAPMRWTATTPTRLTDEFYGEVSVYRDSLQMAIPFEVDQDIPQTITVGFQGCSDAGICFAPQTQTVALDAMEKVTHSTILDEVLSDNALTTAPASSWVHDNLWLAIGGFFLLGVGLSLSPCMLPMLPVVSAMILGSARHAARGAQLSSLYVAGMISVYAAMGWLVASIGATSLQAVMRQPVIVISFALMMILAGVFTMGLFQLRAGRFSQMVSAFQDRVPGGSSLGAYLMGILATLILSPCVTGPLAGALLYIATTGDVVKGTLSLASLGLGMGIPLIAVGIFGKRILPSPGAWMDLVKVLMGWVLIAMALWLISEVVTHKVLLMLITPVTVIFLSHMLRGVLRSGRETVVRIVMMIASISLWLYVALGDEGTSKLYDYPSYTDFDAVEMHIKKTPGEVIVKVTADWCMICERIERNIFQNPVLMEPYSGDIIYYDVTANSAENRETMKDHQLFGPPALIKYHEGIKVETHFGDTSKQAFAKWVGNDYTQLNE